jgi:poly-gamma-glutamate capsule biosynthesis protein CapA/YwtB (metallophosphatase superfamily)
MSDLPLRRPSRRRFLGSAVHAGLAAPLAGLAAGEPARAEAVQSGRSPTIPALGGNETALAFAGDLFLTHPFPEHVQPGTEQVYDVMRRAGAAFANLENGLSTGGSAELGGYRWGAPLRGHPSLVKELTRIGVDVVSTANNHTCNFGRDALLETLATLDGAGVRHAGGGRTIAEAFRPARLEVNGVRIAFFSVYSCHYNRVSQEVATATLPGVAVARAYDVLLETPGNFEERNVPPNIFQMRVNPAASVMAPLREDVLRLSEAIRRGKGDADLAILYVHFHWARHTKADLPYHQRVVAHAAIDAGIDLFVGHGPHTLRGVEMYGGKPVLFSIGNFILQRQASASGRGAAEPSHGHQSVVVRVAVADKRIARVEFLPIAIEHDGQPRFAADDTGRAILHRLSALSAEFGTELVQRDWYAAVDVDARTTPRTAQA